jgi:hypothetical protein
MTLKKEEDTYMREEALDCTLWRARFGRDYGSVVRQNNA